METFFPLVALPRALRLETAEPTESLKVALTCLAEALEARGGMLARSAGGPGAVPLRLVREPHEKEEGYRLRLTREGILLAAPGPRAFHYGLLTLTQLLVRSPARIPSVEIRDAPAFPHRGVLLDVSRGRVPTMETLEHLVEMLAAWKVNQLQLYMEHTFAYPGHEVVWRDASPFGPEEVQRLDAFCRERHVELVPCQNSLGHMHRWLRHPPYRHLAECPEGIPHLFSLEPEPFSLCPTDPQVLEFLAGLYRQLLPNFRSRHFNANLDEPLELGRGRSREACAEKGRLGVYLDFLRRIHGLARRHRRRLMIWSDVLRQDPSRLAQVPRDVILLEWGYEADHRFEPFLAHCRTHGLTAYVCPGTSSWNSLGGRTTNMLANVSRAAQEGLRGGAEGLLVTDWGDRGHLQPLPVSFPGLLVAAGLSWNPDWDAGDREELARRLDAEIFRDAAGVMGRVVLELGDVYLLAGPQTPNASPLFRLLVETGESPLRGLRREGLARVLQRLDELEGRLRGARMERPDASLVVKEIAWVIRCLALAARLGLVRLRDPQADPSRLAQEVRERIAEHRTLWLRRSRPGGLAESCRWLEQALRFSRRDPG
jgi:hypothetical protein